jgi:hypothetical protein
MAELDAFEARFAAACRRYLDEAPTEVDAAAVARTVIALPPARRLPWPATLRGAPALAWLLLLAILLATLAAGIVFVGSQLQARLPAVVPPVLPTHVCPPGSTPDDPGPADQARPPGWSEMAFDRRAGKLVVVAANTDGSDQESWTLETWTFDVCTNTWTRMRPEQEPPALMSQLVYDVDSDLTLGVQYKDWLPPPEVFGSVWAYDLETNTWAEKGVAPTNGSGFYDPVAGLVVRGQWAYDVETDTWTPLGWNRDCGGLCVYDTSVDRVIAYRAEDPLETWVIDPRTGASSRSGAETPDCTMHMWAYPAIVYDEAAQRTLVTGNTNMCAYDAAADRWETLLLRDPSGVLPRPQVYDPVNERLLMFDSGLGDIVAFDLMTHEWTVLLESRG